MSAGLWRDPLVHFLCLSALLFALHAALVDEPSGDFSQTIVVDEPSLLRFIAFRSSNFDADYAQRRLAAMNAAQLEELVGQYVQEEAQYRTAVSYALDQDDYVIRRRLVQKMDFMAEGVVRDAQAPDQLVLQAYLDEHEARYREPAQVTFTHVFFAEPTPPNGEKSLELRAAQTLKLLNAKGVTFSQAPGYGERFPYALNYVERTLDDLAAHFGMPMAEALLALTPDAQRWRGPLRSEHGVHLVLLTERQAERRPAIAEILGRVRSDYLAEQVASNRRAFVAALQEEFEIDVAPELQLRLEP